MDITIAQCIEWLGQMSGLRLWSDSELAAKATKEYESAHVHPSKRRQSMTVKIACESGQHLISPSMYSNISSSIMSYVNETPTPHEQHTFTDPTTGDKIKNTPHLWHYYYDPYHWQSIHIGFKYVESENSFYYQVWLMEY